MHTHVYTCVIVDEGSPDSHSTDMSISGEEGHCKTLKKEGRSEILVKYIYIYLTIIPRGRVGYEMIDSQRGA